MEGRPHATASGDGVLAGEFIPSGSIIFNDNSSSRIGVKFYEYIAKFIFATFWVLEKRKYCAVSSFFPVSPAAAHCHRAPRDAHLLHLEVHRALLPGLGALDVELHTHVFQPIFYIFNETVKKMRAHRPKFLSFKNYPRDFQIQATCST